MDRLLRGAKQQRKHIPATNIYVCGVSLTFLKFELNLSQRPFSATRHLSYSGRPVFAKLLSMSKDLNTTTILKKETHILLKLRIKYTKNNTIVQMSQIKVQRKNILVKKKKNHIPIL